jgi:hypothetical protein
MPWWAQQKMKDSFTFVKPDIVAKVVLSYKETIYFIGIIHHNLEPLNL